jgi:hypothetical protein
MHHHNISTSSTYSIHTTNTSCSDSPSTGGAWCTTIGRKKFGGTRVRSPTLVADSTTRNGCGDVTGHATDRRTIGVAEVRLLPCRKHILSLGEATGVEVAA